MHSERDLWKGRDCTVHWHLQLRRGRLWGYLGRQDATILSMAARADRLDDVLEQGTAHNRKFSVGIGFERLESHPDAQDTVLVDTRPRSEEPPLRRRQHDLDKV
jgi:hypothetical protein